MRRPQIERLGHCVLAATDVEAACRFPACGLGMKRIEFGDPDGNLIEVWNDLPPA